MKVVTSGFPYLDIDAYAGCVAYAELLNLQGDLAIVVSTAPFNESITPTIRSWPVSIEQSYQSKDDDEYVLIDLSDESVFDTFVKREQIVEIIDHHPEFEAYWQAQPDVRSQIEFVGAACTQVYERWERSELLPKISQTSARLLVTGILDNTLNLRASITTERDHKAYEALRKYADLPTDWPSIYFTECQQSIEIDPVGALRNDIKQIIFPSFDKPFTTGQLALWNAKSILDQLSLLREDMPDDDQWFINIISIGEGKSYLIASDESVQKFLQITTKAVFDGNAGVTDRLWLRKEIMKRAIEMYS